MDPTRAFKNWQETDCHGTAIQEADNIIEWLRNGGFFPDISIEEWEQLKMFCRKYGLCLVFPAYP